MIIQGRFHGHLSWVMAGYWLLTLIAYVLNYCRPTREPIFDWMVRHRYDAGWYDLVISANLWFSTAWWDVWLAPVFATIAAILVDVAVVVIASWVTARDASTSR